MGDRTSMSISVDSPLDETLNRGPLALLLRRQYDFLLRITIMQFSFFFFFNFQLCADFHGCLRPGSVVQGDRAGASPLLQGRLEHL